MSDQLAEIQKALFAQNRSIGNIEGTLNAIKESLERRNRYDAERHDSHHQRLDRLSERTRRLENKDFFRDGRAGLLGIIAGALSAVLVALVPSLAKYIGGH